MMLFKIFVGLIVIATIRTAYLDLKDSYNTVVAREEAANQRLLESIQRDQREAREREEKREELTKQLEAIQYQLKLVESLDGFRSIYSNNEKDIKKALALEKQYNALWTKERKLKRELEKLDS